MGEEIPIPSPRTRSVSAPIRSIPASLALSPGLRAGGSLHPKSSTGLGGFLDNFRRTHLSLHMAACLHHPSACRCQTQLVSTDSDAETTKTTVENEEKSSEPAAPQVPNRHRHPTARGVLVLLVRAWPLGRVSTFFFYSSSSRSAGRLLRLCKCSVVFLPRTFSARRERLHTAPHQRGRGEGDVTRKRRSPVRFGRSNPAGASLPSLPAAASSAGHPIPRGGRGRGPDESIRGGAGR